jgi:hypothetical protein
VEVVMAKRSESRTWATRDRTIVPRQRVHARAMRANPTDAEQKLWWHLRHRLKQKDIQRAIASTPTPNPSPQGGGENRRARGE